MNEFLDPKELKKTKEAEEDYQRKRQLRISDLRKLLKIPEGRRFIWGELERTQIFAPSYSNNANQTAYNEGQRSVGIAILADVMEANASAFYQMFTEAMSKDKAAKKEEETNGRPA